MLNKAYEKLIKFIKTYYRLIIGLLLIAFLFNYKLDYEIYTYGKPINLDSRIEVENSFNSKGDLYLTYVSARPGIIPLILLSYIIPSWDLVSLEGSRIENEDYKEILERGKIDLMTVNNLAIKNALDEANINYTEENNSLLVYYVFDNADTNLKVGDVIKEVNGISISTYEEFTNIINSKEAGEKLFISVISGNKMENKYGIIREEKGKKIIGIYLVNDFTIYSNVNISFKYKNSESGSSGGLMSALYIYNAITKNDITKGKKIAGTGTINYDGTIGSIGGVKYKLLGAVRNKSDIFIVPSGENYEEAKKIVEEYNYSIKLIKAKTLKNVLRDLKSLY